MERNIRHQVNAVGGIAGLLAIALLGAVLHPVLTKGDRSRPVCFSNLRQLATGFTMYSCDFDDRMPIAQGWADRIQPYVKSEKVNDCNVAGRYGYAMNVTADGLNTSALTPEKLSGTPLAFDSSALGRSVVGTLALLPNPGRHEGANNIAYVDGHVKAVRIPR